MLRISSFILIMLYSAFFAVGLPLSVHYCGSSVIGISVYEYAENEGCCDEGEKDNCCYNQHAYLKAAKDHQVNFSNAGKQMPQVLFLPSSFNTIQTATVAQPYFSSIETDTGPPVSRWVLLCTARI